MNSKSQVNSTNTPSINYLFIFLLLIELARFFYIVFAARMVVHDSFFRFTFQYYFLNNYFQTGQLPHWIPYMTHGTTAYWWHTLQGVFDLSTYIIPITGKLFKDVPYFILFNLGVFLSRLILLSGTWLLGRRLFKSSCSVFVVTLSMMVCSLGESQAYFNFSFYYALPLVIYLGHRFIDTAQWRYFFMAINLYALQMFGNAAYFLPISSLVLILYFGFYGILNFGQLKRLCSQVEKGGAMALSLIGVGLSLWAVYFFMSQGMHTELVRSLPGRTADGAILFDQIQNWAQQAPMTRWADMIFGISLDQDVTFYIGILTFLFAALAILGGRYRLMLPMAAVIVVLFLFSRATALTQVLYAYWPLMSFYKNLYLVSPLITFWICLMAGFGCDYLMSRTAGRVRDYCFMLCGVIFCAVGMAIYYASHHFEYIVMICDWMGFEFIGRKFATGTLNTAEISRLFFEAAIRHVVLGVLLLFAFFQFEPKWRRGWVIVLLLFHMTELGLYSYQQINRRTASIASVPDEILEYQPMPFSHRRELTIPKGYPRSQIVVPEMLKQTVMYWSFNAFLFHDPAGSMARADHWLKPYDQLMRTFWNQPLEAKGESPKWVEPEYFSIRFPEHSESAMRISGISVNKIRFYRKSYWVENLEYLADILTDSMYEGGRLFLSETSQPDVILSNKIRDWSDEMDLMGDDRIELNYEIVNFDSNSLEIQVLNPATTPLWMVYSDTWHPDWRATVNGLSVPIYKAQMAYKAVKIQPGQNQIVWQFYRPKLAFLTRVVGMTCLAWMLWIGWMTIKLMGPKGLEISEIEYVDT